MRTTNWQNREAARIGNNRTIGAVVDHWTDDEAIPQQAINSPAEVHAREIRAENIRRTAAAA